MLAIIGYDRLGMFCDVYDNGKKLARIFQDGYYEKPDELKTRAIKEAKEGVNSDFTN